MSMHGSNNCIEAKRSLFYSVSWALRTNGMDTEEYATFRYDTFEVENGLNQLLS